MVEGPNGTSVVQFMRLDVEEPVASAPPVPGWRTLLRKIANEDIGAGELVRMLGGPEVPN